LSKTRILSAPRITRRRAAPLALACLACAPGGAVAAQDPYFVLQGHKPGLSNYVRRSEIQAFVDASPGHCIVILGNGDEIRAFQKCSTMTDELNKDSLVVFATSFGSVLLSPFYIYDLLSSTSGCRLNLRNGRHVTITIPCAEAHKALPRE
jgi:hypothetical protein